MKLLVVEDDLALSDVVDFTLRRAGFDVVRAYDGLTAVTLWEQEAPDLILMDLNLPRLDGLAVCRQIRSQSDTPIIIRSVRGGDEAVVKGLELGADDYIVKPFSPTQLVARVRALLRRAGATPTAVTLVTAVFTLDRSRSELRLPDQDPIRLTPLECRLLEILMHNAGQVLPAATLITTIWGAEGGDRTMLKQLVYRLRAKIEPDPSQPTYLETIPGVGYALRQEG